MIYVQNVIAMENLYLIIIIAKVTSSILYQNL